MEAPNLTRIIDYLLTKPLSTNHHTFLRMARVKQLNGKLLDFDRAYLFYLWEEFGPPQATNIADKVTDVSADSSQQAKGSDAEKKIEKRPEPILSLADLKLELEKANRTIARLRETGKRAVAQRDQWEVHAKALEKKVQELMREAAQAREWEILAKQLEKRLSDLATGSAEPDRKFEQAKRAFAKLYHPNAATNRSSLQQMIRSEIFKEFWAELERIEDRRYGA